MRSTTLGLLAAISLAAGPAWSASATLKLEPAVQSRLGVTTRPLVAQSHVASASGFARGLDATPLATLDSQIAAAAATLEASQAEAKRARDLNRADQTVSTRAAEAAAAQARADAAQLRLLRQRLGLEWAPALARLSDLRRGQLVADLAGGRAVLVRIDLNRGQAATASRATLDLGGGQRASAEVLGPMRVADAALQTTGLLALVRGPQAALLGSGSVAPATVGSGAAVSGVVVPREALLRTAGRTFAYVRQSPTTFERRELEGPIPDPGGLFVSAGFRPGEAVVVKGAAQLFAAERPSQAGE